MLKGSEREGGEDETEKADLWWKIGSFLKNCFALTAPGGLIKLQRCTTGTQVGEGRKERKERRMDEEDEEVEVEESGFRRDGGREERKGKRNLKVTSRAEKRELPRRKKSHFHNTHEERLTHTYTHTPRPSPSSSSSPLVKFTAGNIFFSSPCRDQTSSSPSS